MTEFKRFISNLIGVTNGDVDSLTIEGYREIIKELNDFLYATHEDIGTTEALGEMVPYFSEFHKYWKAHHKEILDIQIDEVTCERVADVLHDVYCRTGGLAFSEIYDTNNLTSEEICRVRFLTANQDFRGSRSFAELTQIFLDDNSIFDERLILDSPEDFIKSTRLTSLSQNDKRVQYAKNIASFLLERGCSPYELIDHYQNDVFALRNAMISETGAGYGYKKTDMFVRDMVVLKVWENVHGFERIDVASDVNTVKIALRTGIMKPAIPLVSSFLDIFCYQYGYVDEMNALAWRRVWEIWSEKYPDESIISPCLLDYFIYNVMGKQICKETLSTFLCETGEHQFKWHSGQNKNCQVCGELGVRHKARVVRKTLPCVDEGGSIAIVKTPFVRSGIASPNYENCPFQGVCEACGNRLLDPPKSISIKGQTGWTSAYSKQNHGGGGLMA